MSSIRLFVCLPVLSRMLCRGFMCNYCSQQLHSKPRLQKAHDRTSRNFLRNLIAGVARSYSDDAAIRCVLPVLWMTPRFHAGGEVCYLPCFLVQSEFVCGGMWL